MGKKATRKLLKKFSKNAGKDLVLKGAKTGGSKGALRNSKVSKEDKIKKKSISLAKVLERKSVSNRKSFDEKAKQDKENDKETKLIVGGKFDPEAGEVEGKTSKKMPTLAEMSFDEFLAAGFNDEETDVQINQEDISLDNENSISPPKENEMEGDESADDFMAELRRLQQTDPEFYSHLKENAAELLDFDLPVDSSKGTQSTSLPEIKLNLRPGQVVVTEARFKEYAKALENDLSAKSISHMVGVIVSAVEMIIQSGSGSDDPDVPDADNSSASNWKQKRSSWMKHSRNSKYVFVDPSVFKKSFVSGLKKLHVQLAKFVFPNVGDRINNRLIKVKKSIQSLFVALASLLQSFCKNIKLGSANLLPFVLDILQFYLPFLAVNLIQEPSESDTKANVPGYNARVLQRCLIGLFSDSLDAKISIAAFLRLKQFILEAFKCSVDSNITRANDLLEFTLKKAYFSFVKEAKFAKTSPTASKLGFKVKCLNELYGINFRISYQLAFNYIRQLSLRLKLALVETKPQQSKESKALIQGPQYIHCLKLWTTIISSYCGTPISSTTLSQENVGEIKSKSERTEELRPLVYPLVQIILGTIDVSSSERFFPLRLQLVNALNLLSAATKMYIPIYPIVQRILASPYLSKMVTKRLPKSVATKGKKENAKFKAGDVDLDIVLRLPVGGIENAQVQDAIVEKTLKLLEVNVEIYHLSVSFPEMALPMLHSLRMFAKTGNNPGWQKSSRLLISKVQEMADAMVTKRKNAGFGPADVSRIFAFSDSLEQQELERKLEVIKTDAAEPTVAELNADFQVEEDNDSTEDENNIEEEDEED